MGRTVLRLVMNRPYPMAGMRFGRSVFELDMLYPAFAGVHGLAEALPAAFDAESVLRYELVVDIAETDECRGDMTSRAGSDTARVFNTGHQLHVTSTNYNELVAATNEALAIIDMEERKK